MKKSAIQFALYLHAHPHTGLEQWKLMRALPQGMSELLQVTASRKKRQELADNSGIEDSVMREALHSFLRLVLADHETCPFRGLAAREKASLETCQKHKKLLHNIFHPDRFPNDYCHEVMQQVQQSYEQIENARVTPLAEESIQSEDVFNQRKETYRTSKPDFVIDHSPRYKSSYTKYQEKKQINYVLVAGITGIALLGVLIMLVVPSGPQSIVRQDVVSLSNQQTSETSKQFTLASNVANTLPSKAISSTVDTQGSRIKKLLNEFEVALEGNLIGELAPSDISARSSKQIIDLFVSAKSKKVFLHNFSWQPTTTGFYGEGEFLTRFEFGQRQQWVTRRGKSSITLSEENSRLLIKQFHFEDNLH